MADIRRLWPPADPTLALVHWDLLAGALFHDAGEVSDSVKLTRPVLIGIRGAKLGDPEDHPLHCVPQYDDCYVLCSPGSMQSVLRGALHSYQANSKLSPDVDHDGRGDVGTIRPGRFVLRHDPNSAPYPVFFVTAPNGSGNLPCWRDVDHDQLISDADKAFSEAARGGPQEDERGCYSTQVLLHTGYDGPADSPHHSSISCLTMPLSALTIVWHEAQKYGGELDCFIVDAAKAMLLLDGVHADEITKPINMGNIA